MKCRGPDDRVYAQNTDIQRYIPRGLTLLVTRDGSDKSIDVVTFANRKFTGGIGDEDDEQPNTNDEWKNYFLQPPSEASFVVCTEKVNGEAAHFSGRSVNISTFNSFQISA